MDFFDATQVLEDRHTTNSNDGEKEQIGMLRIGSADYPIVKGFNKIGRSPMCEIIITDPTISKVHAEIQAGNEATFICDLRSSNGSTFKGLQLRPFYYYPLNDGDVVLLGQVSFVYSSIIKKTSERQDEVTPKTPVQTRTQDARQTSSSLLIPGDDLSFGDPNESVVPGSEQKQQKRLFRLPGVPVDRQKNRGKNNASAIVGDAEVAKEKNESHDKAGRTSIEKNGEKSNGFHDAGTQNLVDREKKNEKSNMVVEIFKITEEKNDSEDDRDQEDIFEMETQKIVDCQKSKVKNNVPDDAKIVEKKIESTDALETADDIFDMESQEIVDCQKSRGKSNIVPGGSKIAEEKDESRNDLETEEDIFEMATQIIVDRPKNKEKSNIVCRNSKIAEKKNNSSDDHETTDIFEMETQKIVDRPQNKGRNKIVPGKTKIAEEMNESCDDLEMENIFEMATQKIVDRPKNKDKNKSVPGNSKIVSKNNESDDPETEDIFEMATQSVVDCPKNKSIHEMETQRIFDRPKSKSNSPIVYDIESRKIDDSSLSRQSDPKRPRLDNSVNDFDAGDENGINEASSQVLFTIDDLVAASPSSSSQVIRAENATNDDENVIAKSTNKQSPPRVSGNDVIAETDDESNDEDNEKRIIDDSDGSITDIESEFASSTMNTAKEKEQNVSTVKIATITSLNDESKPIPQTDVYEAGTQLINNCKPRNNEIIDDVVNVDLPPTQVLDVATSTPMSRQWKKKRNADKANRNMEIMDFHDSPKQIIREEIADSSTEITEFTNKRAKKKKENENMGMDLDDSIARNLGNMFGDEANNNDDMMDEPTQMLTQNLVDILKPTQSIAHDRAKSPGPSILDKIRPEVEMNDDDSRKSPSPKRKKFQDTLGFVDGRAVSHDEFLCTPSSSTSNKKPANEPEKIDEEKSIDDEDDILFGLPEVRIYGTLSNPGSPTSSTVSSDNDPYDRRNSTNAREASIVKKIINDTSVKIVPEIPLADMDCIKEANETRVTNEPDSPPLTVTSRLKRKRVLTNRIVDDDQDSDDAFDYNDLKTMADKLLATDSTNENGIIYGRINTRRAGIRSLNVDKSIAVNNSIVTSRRTRELSEKPSSLIVTDSRMDNDLSINKSETRDKIVVDSSRILNDKRKRLRKVAEVPVEKEITQRRLIDEWKVAGVTNAMTTAPMLPTKPYAKVHLTRLNDSEVRAKKSTGSAIVEDLPIKTRRVATISAKKLSVTSAPKSPARTKGRRTIGHGADPPATVNCDKKKILFTGVSNEDYDKMVAKLGGIVVSIPAKANVLITNKIRRTFKFLCAVGQGLKIVSIAWLLESHKAGRFLNTDNFILDDQEAEEKYNFKLAKSLQISRVNKLLDGYTIIVTPKVNQPEVHEIKGMVEACGGRVLVRAARCWDAKTVIISREDDLVAAKSILSKAPKDLNLTIQSTEFILTGILRQEINLVDHKLI